MALEPVRSLHHHLQQQAGMSLADPTDVAAVLHWALQTLDTADFGERWEIAKLLPPCGAVAIAPVLDHLQQLDDDDWELQWYLIRVLGDCRHPDALAALAHHLQTATHPDIAQAAAIALANMGSLAIPILGRLLDTPTVRPAVVQALAQLSDPAVVPLLASIVTDSDGTVRAAALEALAQHPDETVVPCLVQALSDPHAAVRRAAAVGLGRFAPLVASADLVQMVALLLMDVNLDVAGQAALTLGRLGTPAAVAALAQPLGSPHTPGPLLQQVIHALGWIADLSAVDILEAFLQTAVQPPSRHCSDAVYGDAIATLAQVEPALRPAATQALIQVLTRGGDRLSPALRQRLALALGHMQDLSSLEPLVQLLADPHPGVRLHAIAALKQLPGEAAYQRLCQVQTQGADNPEASSDLSQGVAIALEEWHR
jgi:HEAT repeat protein